MPIVLTCGSLPPSQAVDRAVKTMEWLKLRHTYDSLPQTENSDEKNLLRGYWWARYVRCARSTAILIFTNTIAVLALLYSVANHRTHELSWKEISTICEY